MGFLLLQIVGLTKSAGSVPLVQPKKMKGGDGSVEMSDMNCRSVSVAAQG